MLGHPISSCITAFPQIADSLGDEVPGEDVLVDIINVVIDSSVLAVGGIDDIQDPQTGLQLSQLGLIQFLRHLNAVVRLMQVGHAERESRDG